MGDEFQVFVGEQLLGTFEEGASIQLSTTAFASLSNDVGRMSLLAEPLGVTTFTIYGIDEGITPLGALGFPVKLAFGSATGDFTVGAVPEPATLSLLGLASLAICCRRRSRAAHR